MLRCPLDDHVAVPVFLKYTTSCRVTATVAIPSSSSSSWLSICPSAAAKGVHDPSSGLVGRGSPLEDASPLYIRLRRLCSCSLWHSRHV